MVTWLLCWAVLTNPIAGIEEMMQPAPVIITVGQRKKVATVTFFPAAGSNSTNKGQIGKV